ncbi:MAG: hypothetical protein LAO76_22190 [Acidobacteriia bacterium]|nr:hypothetical protein [Terriglobia bacterium]
MRIIPDQLRSKNLVPFKKRHGRYKIPGMTSENEVLMDRVDPDLSPEEQSYVRHYLGYADALMRGAEENVVSEKREASAPEEAPSAKSAPAELRLTMEPDTGLTNEPNPATKGGSVRAA